MVKVLFVCLGNICRSPTAHGVFRDQVDQAKLNHLITIDSAGTGDWHIGHQPDKRATAAACDQGYDISDLRARQVTPDDFDEFDVILAMDNSNLSNLEKMKPSSFTGQLKLFLDYLPDQPIREVPDPYYGGNDDFVMVLTLVEKASRELLEDLKNRC